MPSFKYPIPTKQFIHGEYVDAKGTQTVALKSSYDDSVIVGDFAYANIEDVDIATESAAKGLIAWQALTPAKRGEHLWNFAAAIEKNGDQIGYYESILVGKPAAFSTVFEPKIAADLFRYFAGFCDKYVGEAPTDEQGSLRIVRNEPLGICAGINAFNSPVATFAMKAAPALAGGNALILKASEFNPFSSLYLAKLAVDSGIPAGVLNVIVGGAEAGEALASHLKIRKISFTGSVATGRKVQAAAMNSNLKRVTLELGGKSPLIIFPDADFDVAVQTGAWFLTMNGQACALSTRIYVHEDIADAYLARLKTIVEQHASTLGSDPLDMTTVSSPMYHARQKEFVMRFLENGKNEAQLITGGKSWGDKGQFVEPTIYFKPIADANILKKEIFGPVAVVDTFKTEEEVLQKANDTEYGLNASIFTKDIDRAIRFAFKLEAGTVTVNNVEGLHPSMAFGGYKSSGIGRENGKAALKEWTQTKSIHIKYSYPTPN